MILITMILTITIPILVIHNIAGGFSLVILSQIMYIDCDRMELSFYLFLV